ncbi:MAG TPA: DUF2071 domain-containing protein [Vicinamibacterales bacterium]
MRRPFLTARWEDLVLINYRCPREWLLPLVPRGTELDPWKGELLISLVGFVFRETRVMGLGIPFHRTFEEVNLRFYVRRTTGGEARRAVVFVRELVPRSAIAAIARWRYNEPYLAVPMAHRSSLALDRGGAAEYSWRYRAHAMALSASADGPALLPPAGSDAEFITEHYWGYTRQRDGSTVEYQVEHPQWPVWESSLAHFAGDGAALYGPAFGEILAGRPHSAFMAKGSEVAVHAGTKIE